MSSPGEAGDVITASLRHPERFAAVFDRHAPHIHRHLARRLGGQVAGEFLFDPVTFAYIGSRTTGSVVSQGIVDAVRQRP